jgi:hypothetical protein
MKVETCKVIYIFEAPIELINKIQAQNNTWAEGDDNICMTFEEAETIDEFKDLLKDIKDGTDVIISF